MRVEVEMDENLIHHVDMFRERAGLTRAGAFRTLIDRGLNYDRFYPSRAQILILSLLCDPNHEFDRDFIADVISRGHFWAIDSEYTNSFPIGATKQEDVDLVLNILSMFSELHHVVDNINAEDRRILEQKFYSLRFQGFDGNHEGVYLDIADILINRMGRFKTLQAYCQTTHTPTLERYSRMLSCFNMVKHKASPINRTTFMTLDQIHEVYAAGRA